MGCRRVISAGLAALTFWSLIFFPLADTKSISLIGLALSGMMVLQGPYMGALPAAFSELFPPAVRYSGASLSVTIGTLFGGALAPLIATTLRFHEEFVAHHCVSRDALARVLALLPEAEEHAMADACPQRLKSPCVESLPLFRRPEWWAQARCATRADTGVLGSDTRRSCGLSDATHLTRTFRWMLGGTPRDLIRHAPVCSGVAHAWLLGVDLRNARADDPTQCMFKRRTNEELAFATS